MAPLVFTYRLSITGRVRGVGFRESLRQRAMREGVVGWVRNRSDGGVEAIVQGPEDAVHRVITWSRRGPPAARVATLRAEAMHEESAHAYDRFEILPTA